MPHVFPFLSHLSALWTFFVSTNTVFHKVAQKSTTHLFFAVRLYWQTTYPTNKYPKSWIFRPVRAALLVYNLNAQYVIFFATKDLSFFFFFLVKLPVSCYLNSFLDPLQFSSMPSPLVRLGLSWLLGIIHYSICLQHFTKKLYPFQMPNQIIIQPWQSWNW